MFKTLNYPPTLYWEVTEICNHNCIHCFNYWRTDELYKRVSYSSDYYLNMAKMIAKNNPVKVVITGGEPLTVFSEIKLAIDHLLSRGIVVGINTNAALVDQDICEFLKTRQISLFVSFPSCNEVEFNKITNSANGFNLVCSALDRLISNGVKFSTNTVVSKININSIVDTVKFLKDEFNLNHASITKVSMPVNAIEHFDDYMLNQEDYSKYLSYCVEAQKQTGVHINVASPITPCSVSTQEQYELFCGTHSCTAGKTSYVVSHNGDIRACVRDSTVYGNILMDDFEKIWCNMNEWRDDSLIPKECIKCKYYYKCRAGCRTDSLSRNGRKDCLDEFSICADKSLEFADIQTHFPNWDNDIAFEVSKSLVSIKECCGYRLSSGDSFVYVTEKLYDYLLLNNEFSIIDFSNNFHVSIDKSTQVLYSLFKKKIIHKKERMKTK